MRVFLTKSKLRVDAILKLLAGAALIGAIFVTSVFWMAKSSNPSRAHGERKERWSGRTFAGQTDVQTQPVASRTAPGWNSERVWSGQDDWEPFIAADPSSNYVYQLTTRFDPRFSAVVFRRSSDNGATWDSDQFIAPVNVWQADPQIQVANDGTIYVVWLDGPNWISKLIKSFDHGQTWTAPIAIAPSLLWTDHPWLVISPDGKDLYIGLNENESYLVASHDFGKSFEIPIKTSNTKGRWWLHVGGAISPAGDVYFAVIDYPVDYRGVSGIYVITSHDHGASWQTRLLDSSEPPPGCNRVAGCTYGFFSSTAAIAVDRNGRILVAYNAGVAALEPQQLWVTTSLDGVDWTRRMPISQPNAEASNGFPAVAAGLTPGDFRVVWQGNKDGNITDWNTYYRRTTDDGATWGPTTQLSDRTHGAPYKHREGYAFPYGDYLGLSVDSEGINHVIWGESISYDGPGGSWYTRGN